MHYNYLQFLQSVELQVRMYVNIVHYHKSYNSHHIYNIQVVQAVSMHYTMLRNV